VNFIIKHGICLSCLLSSSSCFRRLASRYFHAAKLGAPGAKGYVADAVHSAEINDLHAGLGLLQNANDLLLGESLLSCLAP